jgi:four helix bundle protein
MQELMRRGEQVRDFKTVKVWERAHELALSVYRITRGFPREEIYGLTSQMRRAASSIPANIAEGFGRSGNGDLHRFLDIAMGSASELSYFLLMSHDLALVSPESYGDAAVLVDEVQRMLASLIRKVQVART